MRASARPLGVRWELIDGGLLELMPSFLPSDACVAWFERVRAAVPFERRQIRILGRTVDQPRLSAWIGDPDAAYTYSGVRNEPLAWPDVLRELRDAVSAAAGSEFNSVLCNLYRDGRDSMGMHADAERELGLEPVIASVSLGAVRRFQLRHRKRKDARLDLDLPDGSLLIMRGALQRHYRHGVPKQPSVTLPRINLTFRKVMADAGG